MLAQPHHCLDCDTYLQPPVVRIIASKMNPYFLSTKLEVIFNGVQVLQWGSPQDRLVSRKCYHGQCSWSFLSFPHSLIRNCFHPFLTRQRNRLRHVPIQCSNLRLLSLHLYCSQSSTFFLLLCLFTAFSQFVAGTPHNTPLIQPDYR